MPHHRVDSTNHLVGSLQRSMGMRHRNLGNSHHWWMLQAREVCPMGGRSNLVVGMFEQVDNPINVLMFCISRDWCTWRTNWMKTHQVLRKLWNQIDLTLRLIPPWPSLRPQLDNSNNRTQPSLWMLIFWQSRMLDWTDLLSQRKGREVAREGRHPQIVGSFLRSKQPRIHRWHHFSVQETQTQPARQILGKMICKLLKQITAICSYIKLTRTNSNPISMDKSQLSQNLKLRIIGMLTREMWPHSQGRILLTRIQWMIMMFRCSKSSYKREREPTSRRPSMRILGNMWTKLRVIETE